MSGTLQENPSVFHIVGSHKCIAIINTTHCCVTRVLIFIILLTATYVRQRHKGNALLHFQQPWLRERATVLRYSTLFILFDLEALSLIYIMAAHTCRDLNVTYP